MVRFVLLLLIVIILPGCERPVPPQQDQSNIKLTQGMGAVPDPGFARAFEPREFVFPADHAAHPEFATEWWYFTGNLQGDNRSRYGYQLTLFRVGLQPGQVEDESSWRSHQLYMGHLAISDIDNRQHSSRERFARSAAGLAGAQQQPLHIWLGSWSIRGSAKKIFPLQLMAETDEIAINLTLQAGSKPLVLQGDRGLSQKGAAPGNASFYYSYTRLPTSGEIRLGKKRVRVTGNSWFDREWSSSALAEDQQGWDWFSLQLQDGRDLMFYRMRDRQGKAQSFSSGVLVSADGRVEALTLDDVQLDAVNWWQNDDGTRYPLGWKLKIPRHQIDLQIEAAFEDQEMSHAVRYWEGAVKVSGSQQGVGYLELSGYAR